MVLRTLCSRLGRYWLLAIGIVVLAFALSPFVVYALRPRLAVLVLDHADAPVPEAKVILQSVGETGLSFTVRHTPTGVNLPRLPHFERMSDRSGLANLGRVPQGRYVLAVAAPENAGVVDHEGKPFHLKRGDKRTEKVTLEQSAVVTGTVRDVDARPMPDVAVWCEPYEHVRDERILPGPFDLGRFATQMGRFRVSGLETFERTDHRGAYTFDHNLPEGRYIVEAMPPEGTGLGPAQRDIRLTPGTRSTVHLVLRPSAVVSGKILERAGRGAGNLFVCFMSTCGSGRAVAYTEADGSFAISEGLSSGQWRVKVCDLAGDRWLEWNIFVELHDGTNEFETTVSRP
jgi:hypothetical protein